MLFVDLRRPVAEEEFHRALGACPHDSPYALTPLAAWLLEREGLPFKTGGDLVDAGWFRAEGLRNTDRVEDAFASCFGSEADAWRGLLNRAKTLLDYALGEEKRWAALAAGGGRVISDVPLSGRESVSWEDHYYNRASLYPLAVGPSAYFEVPRRPGGWRGWAARLRGISPAGLVDKVRDRLAPGRTPALVTRYDGDWASYKPLLRRSFGAVSPEQLAREALADAPGPAAAGPEPEASALVSAVRERVGGLLPLCQPRVDAILEREASRYARLKRGLAGTVADAARRRGVRAALSVACSGYEEYLVHHYLKAEGTPTLFHQHGAYMSRPMFMRSAEAAPATHVFCYGSADAGFYAALGGDATVLQAGSTGLSPDPLPAPGGGRYLYVLLHVEGNALNATSPLHYPDTDATSSFRRHRRVAELFARHPGAELVIREHPAAATWCLYEPLAELIAREGYPNVRLDRTPGPTARFLRGYDGVVLDYVCTTAIVSLAAGQRTACHMRPFALDPDGDAVLRAAAECAEDDDALVALLGRWLAGEPSKTDPEARRRFVGLYAGEPGSRAGEGHLRRLLGLGEGPR